MKTESFTSLFALCMLASCSVSEKNKLESRPNVVFILADDLGYGDVSCYGQEKFTTPNIDALASEGMKFTQFYAGCTVSAPSRCSLMTGFHTGHAQVRGNRELKGEGQLPMAEGTYTIARMFKDNGYATGLSENGVLASLDLKEILIIRDSTSSLDITVKDRLTDIILLIFGIIRKKSF